MKPAVLIMWMVTSIADPTQGTGHGTAWEFMAEHRQSCEQVRQGMLQGQREEIKEWGHSEVIISGCEAISTGGSCVKEYRRDGVHYRCYPEINFPMGYPY